MFWIDTTACSIIAFVKHVLAEWNTVMIDNPGYSVGQFYGAIV
jgi:hypothetical protein